MLRSGEAAEQMRRCCARSRPRVCVCACVCVAFGCVRYIFLILLLFGYCAVLRAVLRVVLRVIGCVAVGRSALCASGFRCVVDCVVGCVVLRVVGCVAVSVRRARRLQGTVKADGRGRVERLRGSDFRGHVRRPGPPRPPRSPPRLPVFSGSAACGGACPSVFSGSAACGGAMFSGSAAPCPSAFVSAAEHVTRRAGWRWLGG